MNILGIETSCDETSAAVLRDGRDILSNVIASQTDLHAKFGGIVPEIASRKHVEVLNVVIQEALDSAGVAFPDLSAVAVTNRPGLVGALLVGVSAAKAISAALSIPLVGVHHLEGHIYANFLTPLSSVVAPPSSPLPPQFPFVCLVVSGGHTDLIVVRGHGDYEILGRTRDDAAGEAFDKSARVLGLGYPGGPIIDQLAQKGDPTAVKFPRSKLDDTLDFSFSGIKTAVIRYVQRSGFSVQGSVGARPSGPSPLTINHQPPVRHSLGEGGSAISLADIAASFQAAVVDMLVNTTLAAVERTGIRRVALAGGVAANSGLQKRMREVASERGLELSCPSPILCTDNAAMIACAGYYHLIRGQTDALDLDTIASEPLA